MIHHNVPYPVHACVAVAVVMVAFAVTVRMVVVMVVMVLVTIAFMVVIVMVVIIIAFMIVVMVMMVLITVTVHMVVIMMVVMLMVMMMLVHRFIFFRAMYGHGHMCSGDPAFFRFFSSELYIGDPEGVQFFDKCIRFGQEFEEGGCQHISGGAHIAFQIKSFHDFPSI